MKNPRFKMVRMPGHSMSIEEQDQLIRMYNEVCELCDEQGESIERTTKILEHMGETMGRIGR